MNLCPTDGAAWNLSEKHPYLALLRGNADGMMRSRVTPATLPRFVQGCLAIHNARQQNNERLVEEECQKLASDVAPAGVFVYRHFLNRDSPRPQQNHRPFARRSSAPKPINVSARAALVVKADDVSPLTLAAALVVALFPGHVSFTFSDHTLTPLLAMAGKAKTNSAPVGILMATALPSGSLSEATARTAASALKQDVTPRAIAHILAALVAHGAETTWAAPLVDELRLDDVAEAAPGVVPNILLERDVIRAAQTLVKPDTAAEMAAAARPAAVKFVRTYGARAASVTVLAALEPATLSAVLGALANIGVAPDFVTGDLPGLCAAAAHAGLMHLVGLLLAQGAVPNLRDVYLGMRRAVITGSRPAAEAWALVLPAAEQADQENCTLASLSGVGLNIIVFDAVKSSSQATKIGDFMVIPSQNTDTTKFVMNLMLKNNVTFPGQLLSNTRVRQVWQVMDDSGVAHFARTIGGAKGTEKMRIVQTSALLLGAPSVERAMGVVRFLSPEVMLIAGNKGSEGKSLEFGAQLLGDARSISEVVEIAQTVIATGKQLNPLSSETVKSLRDMHVGGTYAEAVLAKAVKDFTLKVNE